MAITKEERLVRKYQHTKQERLQVKQGIPLASNLREGVPELWVTHEDGLVEYVEFPSESGIEKSKDIPPA